MSSRPRRVPVIIQKEELEAEVVELLALARSEGDRLRRAGTGVRRFSDRKPDVTDYMYERLRSALEDEMILAVELDGPPGAGERIEEREFEHEVIKKALVGLHAEALKKIARRRSLEVGGALEALAVRIAQDYKWNGEDIAQLVLENAPEGAPERGHTVRLFPLAIQPDLPTLRPKLEYVLSRYIRIGVARWFVFRSLEQHEDGSFSLRGALRAYQATLTNETRPSVIGVPGADREVTIVIDGGDMLRVSGGKFHEALAAVRALELATRITRLGYVPLPGTKSAIKSAPGWAPVSLMMLDLIHTRLFYEGFTNRNLTTARFRMSEESVVAAGDEHNADAESDQDEGSGVVTRRPSLRAVRFEGDHLLDSITACKLLADEKRALVDIAMTATSPEVEGEKATFPIRVSVESDHVMVFTGFGIAPSVSSVAHKTLTTAIEEELSEGIVDEGALLGLLDRISRRAQSHAIDDLEADMLTDSQ
ncbi:MAG: hypothetical protein JWM47_1789 [Acidimicrobiales bacterium]|nr:hypothetical protein [Acidimicrobiales bacterium]